MRRIGFAFAVLAIVAVATWAYNVNYETKTTLGRIDGLRAAIAAEREHLQVLRVEWAWANNPERLQRLADAHVGVLALAPMTPEVFDLPEAIPFPPEEPADPDLPAGPGESPSLEGALLAAALAGPELPAAPGARAPEGAFLPPPRPAAIAAAWGRR